MNKLSLDKAQIWQQVCALYQNNSVQKICLNWQEQHQANVNLILILSWLEYKSYRFSEPQLTQLLIKLNEFNQHTTGLIRQARFNWRNYQTEADYQTIKQALLTAELMFEQQEQALIIDTLNQYLASPTPTTKTLAPFNWYAQTLKLNLTDSTEFESIIGKQLSLPSHQPSQ
ncbi:TIGR02444 family protein [Catenovulum sp. 2E275]|uniref:TIGR02444 family protein n=1 Tax=Catenovulum sp. 2E275 TaxID=2980497 RepID=UPI0021CFB513|nr:TIGR02444 family protein [Catenovulum sp. 2E275]MCU4675423.1 TIGR02444 family protein [Catenovulum sp. 2E275]